MAITRGLLRPNNGEGSIRSFVVVITLVSMIIFVYYKTKYSGVKVQDEVSILKAKNTMLSGNLKMCNEQIERLKTDKDEEVNETQKKEENLIQERHLIVNLKNEIASLKQKLLAMKDNLQECSTKEDKNRADKCEAELGLEKKQSQLEIDACKKKLHGFTKSATSNDERSPGMKKGNFETAVGDNYGKDSERNEELTNEDKLKIKKTENDIKDGNAKKEVIESTENLRKAADNDNGANDDKANNNENSDQQMDLTTRQTEGNNVGRAGSLGGEEDQEEAPPPHAKSSLRREKEYQADLTTVADLLVTIKFRQESNKGDLGSLAGAGRGMRGGMRWDGVGRLGKEGVGKGGVKVNDNEDPQQETGDGVDNSYKAQRMPWKKNQAQQVSGQQILKKNIPGQQIPDQPIPGRQISNQKIPGQPIPGRQIRNQQIPGRQISNQKIPGQPIPGRQIRNQQIPGQPIPGQQIPNQQIPGQQIPGQQIPNQQIPGQQIPGQQIPNQQIPGQQILGQQRNGYGHGRQKGAKKWQGRESMERQGARGHRGVQRVVSEIGLQASQQDDTEV